MNKLKLAAIGYGGMGSYHLEHLLPTEKDLFEIVGIYDIKDDRRTLATQKGLKAYQDRSELLSDPSIDCVLIATPNDSHKEIAIAALEAGKHVVCEKPVAMNAAELRDIMAVAEKTGKIFMVHQNRRLVPNRVSGSRGKRNSRRLAPFETTRRRYAFRLGHPPFGSNHVVGRQPITIGYC